MAENRHIIGGTAATAAFIALCMHFTAPHEGIKYDAYKDSVGVWTICRGHTAGVKAGDHATQEQCDQYFRDDLAQATVQLDSLAKVEIPTGAKVVFVDFIFNVGVGNFQSSTMLKKINSGDFAGACREFSRWTRAGGKNCFDKSNNCYGIIIRRLAQQAECLRGLQ